LESCVALTTSGTQGTMGEDKGVSQKTRQRKSGGLDQGKQKPGKKQTDPIQRTPKKCNGVEKKREKGPGERFSYLI